jgi:hypothetical protein
MKFALALAVVGLFGQSTVEAFGAASTSNVRSFTRTNADLNMKIFDWRQRELFENYKVPDGKKKETLWRQFQSFFSMKEVSLIYHNTNE